MAGFCVQRHLDMLAFIPEPFWSIIPHVLRDDTKCTFDWERERLFDQKVSLRGR